MKIGNSSPISSKELQKKKSGSVSGGGFSAYMSDGVEKTSSTMPTIPISALAMLNEVEDAVEAPKKSVERGNDMLDELEKIRDGLLFGGISVSRLENIQRMLANKQGMVQDPKLAEIIEEIEIRAAVELAKLGRFI